MPCRPSASISSTLRPACASASARAAATVVLPVPPFPVTTCSRTPSQSVSRALTLKEAMGIIENYLSDHAVTALHTAGAGPLPRLVLVSLRLIQRAKEPVTTGEEVSEMVAALVVIFVLIVLGGVITAARSIRVVQQFEQGIVF